MEFLARLSHIRSILGNYHLAIISAMHNPVGLFNLKANITRQLPSSGKLLKREVQPRDKHPHTALAIDNPSLTLQPRESVSKHHPDHLANRPKSDANLKSARFFMFERQQFRHSHNMPGLGVVGRHGYSLKAMLERFIKSLRY